MAGGTRNPAARLGTSQDAVQPADIRAFLRLLSRDFAAIDGADVFDLETDGTTNANFYRHGLNRLFRGAMLYSSTHEVALLPPDEVKSLGKDPAIWFAARCSTAITVRLSARVF